MDNPMGAEETFSAVLQKEINQIADQLCLSVKGDFDFSINTQSKNQSIQKLCLLINFIINTARQALNYITQKNEQLTELDKLKSEFVTNISHELRTPLTLLLGPLELLLKDQSLVLPSTHLENVRRIQRNAAKLYFLVNDLLDFSKIDAGCFALKNELVDLNQYLSGLSEPNTKGIVCKNIESESNQKPLILIAEDNADMRAYMQVLLEDRFDIILAENGTKAIELINKKEPQVILTDAMMPYMDGYQLTKAVKANNKTKHIPVILVTAKTGNESIISGLDVGANDYLSKPFLPEELIARIQASLRTYYDYVALTQANLKLEQEIEERKKLEFKNNELNSQLVLAARQAGMADIATNVLHNIGNVLNSANISTSMINHKLTHTRISDLEKITLLLQQNKKDLSNYLTKDKTGKHILQYLELLTNACKEDHRSLINETNLLKNNIEHIKNIIMQQQNLGRTIGFNEKTSIPELIEHCISLNNLNNNTIDIVREYEPIKEVILDKVKLMQIVVNLIKNSMDALQESQIKKKQITVRTYEKNKDFFIIQIADNGIGIAQAHLEKIFSHGFTTKKTGHGYGLHASAVSIQEMNGSLTVKSKGLKTGATFILTIPYYPLRGESHGTKANSSSG